MQTTTDNLQPLAAQTAAPVQKKTQAHLPSIDGLRALAAIGVVYVHCWSSNGIQQSPQFDLFGMTVPLYRFFSLGYTGVFLFFVLSGFCLSYPLFSRPDRPDNWPGYFLSRVRRILPAYLISFVIIFLIGQWLHQHSDDEFLKKCLYEPFKVKRFVRELLLIQKSKVVGSYWTLVLEWRWYLFFPALLMLARRISPALVFLLTCGIAYLPHIPAFAGPIQQSTFDNVLMAMPMFGLGIWAAYLSTTAPEKLYSWERGMIKQTHFGVIAGAIWCFYFCPPVTNAPLNASVTAWSPLYFFLILAAIKHPLFHKIFGWAPVAKLGLFSYSIYLVQEPIVRTLNHLIHRPEHGFWTYMGTNFVLIPVICILAGWGFYYIGERPFLKRQAYQRRPVETT